MGWYPQWKAIEDSPEYQKYSDSEQNQIRNQFFEKELAGDYFSDELDEAKQAFDEITAPRGDPDSGIVGDIFHGIKAGAWGSTADIAQGITAGNRNAVADTLRGYQQENIESMSPSMIRETEEFGIGKDAEGNWGFKEGSSALGFLGNVTQGVGSLFPNLVPGAAAGKVLSIGGKALAGVGKAQQGARTYKTAKEAMDIGARIDKVSDVLGAGVAGGVQTVGSTANQIYEDIYNQPLEELIKSEKFRQFYHDANSRYGNDAPKMAEQEARKKLAEEASMEGRAKAFGLGFASYASGNPIEVNLLKGLGGKGRLLGAAKGAIVEAGQEAVEGGYQQRLMNEAADTMGLDRDLNEGVVENMATGMLLGGTIGAAIGGIPGQKRPNQPNDPNDPNAPDARKMLEQAVEGHRVSEKQILANLSKSDISDDQKDQYEADLRETYRDRYNAERQLNGLPPIEKERDKVEAKPKEEKDFVPRDVDDQIIEKNSEVNDAQQKLKRAMKNGGNTDDLKRHERTLAKYSNELKLLQGMADNRQDQKYFNSTEDYIDWVLRKQQGGNKGFGASIELAQRKQEYAQSELNKSFGQQLNIPSRQDLRKESQQLSKEKAADWVRGTAQNVLGKRQRQQQFEQLKDEYASFGNRGMQTQSEQAVQQKQQQDSLQEANRFGEQQAFGMAGEQLASKRKQALDKVRQQKKIASQEAIETGHKRQNRIGRYQTYPVNNDTFAVTGTSTAESADMRKLGGSFNKDNGYWEFPKAKRQTVEASLKALDQIPQKQRKPEKQKKQRVYPKTIQKRARRLAAKGKQGQQGLGMMSVAEKEQAMKAEKQAMAQGTQTTHESLPKAITTPEKKTKPPTDKELLEQPGETDEMMKELRGFSSSMFLGGGARDYGDMGAAPGLPKIKIFDKDNLSGKEIDAVAKALGLTKRKKMEQNSDREKRLRNAYQHYLKLKEQSLDSLLDSMIKEELRQLARSIGIYKGKSFLQKKRLAEGIIGWRNDVGKRYNIMKTAKNIKAQLINMSGQGLPIPIDLLNELDDNLKGGWVYTEGDKQISVMLGQDTIPPKAQREGEAKALYDLAEKVVEEDEVLVEQLRNDPAAMALMPKIKEFYLSPHAPSTYFDLSPAAKALGVPDQYAQQFGSDFDYELVSLFKEMPEYEGTPVAPDMATKPEKVDTTVEPVQETPEPIQEGSTTTVAVPGSDIKLDVQYKVVENKDLITSHNIKGDENPDYPAELQPRDRTRQGSEEQIIQLAGKFDPALATANPLSSDGAPIVNADNQVESGNGRTLALRNVYGSKPKLASQYKQYLIDHASEFGLDPDVIEAMDRPQLVRERQNDLTDQQLQEYLQQSNNPNIAESSATEQAFNDAKIIDEDLIQLFNPGADGSLQTAGNLRFLDKFFQKIKGSSNKLRTSDGKDYTKQFFERLQGALFAKAYENKALVSLALEENTEGVTNILKALNVSAPEFARIKAKHSDLADLNLVEPLVDGLRVYREAKANNQAIDEYISQGDMLSGDSVPYLTGLFAQFIDANERRHKQMGLEFTDLAKKIGQELDLRAEGNTMLGEHQSQSLDDILSASNRNLRAQNEQIKTAGGQQGLLTAGGQPTKTEKGEKPGRPVETERVGSEQGQETGGKAETANQRKGLTETVSEPLKENFSNMNESFRIPGTDEKLLTHKETIETATGRMTTGFPKWDFSTIGKARNSEKRINEWLMDNAIEEAKARGDGFNLRQFESGRDKPSISDIESANMYLFDSDQTIQGNTSILKDLGTVSNNDQITEPTATTPSSENIPNPPEALQKAIDNALPGERYAIRTDGKVYRDIIKWLKNLKDESRGDDRTAYRYGDIIISNPRVGGISTFSVEKPLIKITEEPEKLTVAIQEAIKDGQSAFKTPGYNENKEIDKWLDKVSDTSETTDNHLIWNYKGAVIRRARSGGNSDRYFLTANPENAESVAKERKALEEPTAEPVTETPEAAPTARQKRRRKRIGKIIELDQEIMDSSKELAEAFRKQAGKLTSGVDPTFIADVLRLGTNTGVLLIKKGAIKFADWADNMLVVYENQGIDPEGVTPYLKELYGAVSNSSQITDTEADQMDGSGTVRRFDLDNLLGDEEVEVEAEPETSAIDQVEQIEPASQPILVEHTTKKGNQLRGIIRDDLTKAEALKIDPYTFRKDGGWFIREKYLTEAPPDTQEIKQETELPPSATPTKLSQALYQHLKTNTLKDNHQLNKFIAEREGIKVSEVTPQMKKEAQEAMEVALVLQARETVAEQQEDRDTYDTLVGQYEGQPLLSIRSSESIEKQAYSTPAPLAYLAGQLAGITQKTTVYEPTAGNGMLLIGASVNKSTTNELSSGRVENLKDLGYKPTKKDALNYVPKKQHDSVITNPPFGRLANQQIVKMDGYNLTKLDHVIAAKALEAMKDDGKAAIIIGANKETGKIGDQDRIFFNWLYSHYNVVDHFEVDGDLYKRQGAGWPVQVITVNGRQQSNTLSPKNDTIPRYNNWNAIYDHYQSAMDSIGQRADGRGTGDTVSEDTTGSNTGSTDTPRSLIEQVSGTGRRNGGRGGRGTSTGGSPDNSGRTASTGTGRGSGGTTQQPAGNITEGQGGVSASGNQRPGTVGTSAGTQSTQRTGNTGKPSVNASSYQVSYNTASGGFNDLVLTPYNMSVNTDKALKTIQDTVGNIDQYVMDKLGYDSEEDLYKAFMGLQVDTIAAAIYNAEVKNKGIIIADQTGVGKGRQAAGIIRYAKNQGKIPIFVTVKDNLFTDMYNDLADIGSHDVNPLILNQDGSIKQMDKEGQPLPDKFKNPASGKHRDIMRAVAATGELPEGRNAIFLTYSQVNLKNLQRDLIKSFGDKAYFVLDESHNAAGDFVSKIPKSKGGGERQTTAGFFAEVIGAGNVTYLSATYAKRPDNMPLYFRTDLLDAVDNMGELISAVEAGGVPLQTVMSNMLAESGQLFRRERSFEGIEIKTVVNYADSKKHQEIYNKVTEGLRSVTEADQTFQEYFLPWAQENAEALGAKIKMAGNQATKSVDHQGFTSIVHNYISQLLMSMKADGAIEQAVQLHGEGKKPVIATDNTMESFLDKMVEKYGLKVGDVFDFDYRDILLVALERTRRLSLKDKKGNSHPVQIELSDLDDVSRAAYEQAEKAIMALDIADLPVSPIDYIRQGMIDNDIRVSEITGRNLIIDYSGDKPVLAKRDSTERKDKRATVDKFNTDQLDVLILNQAGSTGLSIHASEKFIDKKPRHMMVMQASLDINTMMQMLGRINRTGQVTLPEYTLMALDLPAEKRPAAILSEKMRSLNANTSANSDSDTSIDAPNILNKYGSKIVNDYLLENTSLARKLNLKGVPDDKDPPADLARKFTGRLALMSVKDQDEAYAMVENEYNALIEYLDKTGQNDLNPQTLDLNARITSSEIIYQGKVPGSVFGGDTTLHEIDARYQGKVPKPEDVGKAIDKALDGQSPEQVTKAILDNKATEGETYIASVNAKIETTHKQWQAELKKDNLGDLADKYEGEKGLESVIVYLQESDDYGKEHKLTKKYQAFSDKLVGYAVTVSQYNTFKQFTDNILNRIYQIGNHVQLDVGDELVTGVVTGIKDSHKSGIGNPYSPSKTKVTIMVNNGIRQVALPLNRLAEAAGIYQGLLKTKGKQDLESIFEPFVDTGERRETRYIATGNLIAGSAELKKDSGRIVSFTGNDGNTYQGILLPRKYKHKEGGKTINTLPLRDPVKTVQFLMDNKSDRMIQSYGIRSKNDKIALRSKGDKWFVVLPQSNKDALVKTAKLDSQLREAMGGDFYSSGQNMMIAGFSDQQLGDVVKRLFELTPMTALGTMDDQLIASGIEVQTEAVQSFDERAVEQANDTDSRYNLVPKDQTPKGMKPYEAKTLQKQLTRAIGDLATVVQNESQLPRHLYNQIKADGVQGRVKGVYDPQNDTVYVVASNAESLSDGMRTALHEAVGHKGLRGVLGSSLNTTLDQIYDSLPASQIRALRKEYETQIAGKSQTEQRRIVAEEHLAHLAETDPQNNLVQRLIAKIRQWMRQYLPSLKWSDSDIRNLMIEASQKAKDDRQTMANRSDSPRYMVDRTGKFILNSDGDIDFGEITPELSKEIRRQEGKIRLEIGDDGYGMQHILIQHGELNKSGDHPGDIVSFIEDILNNPDQIAAASGGQLVIIKRVKRNHVVFIDLMKNKGEFWTIKSTHIRKNLKHNGVLWERITPAQPSPVKGSLEPGLPDSAGKPPLNDKRDHKAGSSLSETADTDKKDTPDSSRYKLSSFANRDAQQTKEAIGKNASSLLESVRSKSLGWLGGRQLSDLYGKVFDAVKGKNPLQIVSDLTQQLTATRSVWANAADRIDNMWARLAANPFIYKQVNQLMYNSTIAEVDPSVEYEPKYDVYEMTRQQKSAVINGDTKLAEELEAKLKEEEQRKKDHKNMKALYDVLPSNAKEVFTEVRDYYQKQWQATRTALHERVKGMGLDANATGKVKAQIDALFHRSRSQGPYFPLMRFGEFAAIGETPDGKPFRQHFESQKAMKDGIKELEASGHIIESSGKTVQLEASQMSGVTTMTSKIMESLGTGKMGKNMDDKTKAAFMDDINQMALSLLPELSAAKRSMHRKKIAGFDTNARRSFATVALHGANRLGRIKYGWQIEAELNRMDEVTDASKFSPLDEDEKIIGRSVAVEMRKRHDLNMNPNGHPIASHITNASFIMYLGGSVGAGLVNMTQNILVALPQLGARYGYAKTSRAMAKASKDYFAYGGKKPEGMEGLLRDSWFNLTNAKPNNNITQDEIDLIKKLIDDGTIDTTQAHTLAQISDSDIRPEVQKNRDWYTKMTRGSGLFFHNAEVANRQIAALTAYRLYKNSKKTGFDPQAGIDFARKAVFDAHFDYSGYNRPRHFKGNWAKVLLIFKQHSQNMTYNLAKTFYDGFVDKDMRGTEDAAIARRTLLGTLGLHAMFAGTMGLPGMSVMLYAAGLAMGDEDDPVDPEVEIRNVFSDWFGTTNGHALAKGIFNGYLNMDMHARTSLNDLWVKAPGYDMPARQEAMYYVTNAIGGPAVSQVVNSWVGLNEMMDTGSLKGLQRMMPKFIRDGLKTIEYSENGVTDAKGKVINDDMTPASLAWQALGIGNAKTSEAYDARGAILDPKAKLTARATQLLDQMDNAIRTNNVQKQRQIQASIDRFNEVQKVNDRKWAVISRSRQRKNLAYKQRARAESKTGIVLPESQLGMREYARSFAL